MDGEDVNTLAGYLQMAILLCRDYFAALAAELKQVLKQDLDLNLDVPKFNCFFQGD